MTKGQTNAVIVEVRGRKAAALTEEGVFMRIRNDRYEIGQQVRLELPERAAQPLRRRARLTAYASMAAGFLLLLFGGFRGYTTPVGVVSLDVNPSVEYTINCFDRVLDVQAVNDDAGQLLAGMDEQTLINHSVDDAIDATILALREDGYFSETVENDVVISASSYDERHTQKLSERLGVRVGQQSDLTVYSVPVSKGDVQRAHAVGASAGKLHIVTQLGENWSAENSFDPGEWIARPVREIIRETKLQQDGKGNSGDDKKTQSGTQSELPAEQREIQPNQPNQNGGAPAPEQGSSDPSREGGGTRQGSHMP